MSSPATSSLDSISRRAQPLLDTLARTVPLRPGLLILAALLGLASVPRLIRNYHEFLALGRGGLPYNVGGWLIALVFKTLARETLDTAVYDVNPDRKSWLEDSESIPERRGTRPVSGFHVVPARQTTKVPGEEMAIRLKEISEKLVKLNSTVVEYGQSPNEHVHQGVLIHHNLPNPHKTAKGARREIFHIHPTDRSMHVVLAPQDAKLAIERNWAERHALSGSPVTGLPSEYLWIYAPRNEEELQVVEKFLVAAIGFMTDRPAQH